MARNLRMSRALFHTGHDRTRAAVPRSGPRTGCPTPAPNPTPTPTPTPRGHTAVRPDEHFDRIADELIDRPRAARRVRRETHGSVPGESSASYGPVVVRHLAPQTV